MLEKWVEGLKNSASWAPLLLLHFMAVDAYTCPLTSTKLLACSATCSYAVLIDGVEKKAGSMFEDFEPSINPPETIPDPDEKKPEDWVDEARCVMSFVRDGCCCLVQGIRRLLLSRLTTQPPVSVFTPVGCTSSALSSLVPAPQPCC